MMQDMHIFYHTVRSASDHHVVIHCHISETRAGCGLWRAGAIMQDMHTIARHTSGSMPFQLHPSEHAASYADDLVSSHSLVTETV